MSANNQVMMVRRSFCMGTIAVLGSLTLVVLILVAVAYYVLTESTVIVITQRRDFEVALCPREGGQASQPLDSASDEVELVIGNVTNSSTVLHVTTRQYLLTGGVLRLNCDLRLLNTPLVVPLYDRRGFFLQGDMDPRECFYRDQEIPLADISGRGKAKYGQLTVRWNPIGPPYAVFTDMYALVDYIDIALRDRELEKFRRSLEE